MRRALLSCYLFLQAASGLLSASNEGPCPVRFTLRHIEPNGVGYKQGYTTLEGFFAPGDFYRGSWLPYLDLRGHVFDNGKLAANAGLGLRYLGERRVWGANAYYDYRSTHRLHYNQAAIGFEVLGEKWDFRLNGYLPVGKKVSRGFSPKFDHFAGHSLFLSRKHEYALASVDGEVGCHGKFRWIPVEVAAGPYYLRGNDQTAWGGKLRAAFDLGQYFRLEGNVSYDHLFKWIGQGQASVIIPFSRRKRWTCRAEYEEVPKCLCETLVNRAYQRVIRSEIIPVDTKRKTQVAIDPSTGAPFFFVFVNNLNGSNGTIEDPYATLAAAQANSSPHDIIYVFTGNGTATGMNSGIVLKDFQQLLGSSITQPIATTQGVITIPAFTLSLPVIGNTGGDVVAVANGNTISGLAISNLNGTGISQSNAGVTITGLTITNNTISSNSSVTRAGIILNNVAGQMVIDRNEIGFEQGGVISLTNANITNAYYAITNNSVAAGLSAPGTPAITLAYTNSSGITTQISNNIIGGQRSLNINATASNSTAPSSAHTFIVNSNKCIDGPFSFTTTNFAQMSIVVDSNENSVGRDSAIELSGSNTSSMTCLIQNNRLFTSFGSGSPQPVVSVSMADSAFIDCTILKNEIQLSTPDIAIAVINFSFLNSSSGTYLISNNTLTNLLGRGIILSHAGTSRSSGSILDNRISSVAAFGILVSNTSSQLSTSNIENNSFLDGTGGISITNSGLFNANILNNQFHENSASGGLNVALSGGGVSRIKANNNQFFSCGTQSVLATTAGANTSLCLQFNNNIATPTQYADGSNPFIFTNTAPALFQLETSTGGEGYFTLTDITSVPPHTCE